MKKLAILTSQRLDIEQRSKLFENAFNGMAPSELSLCSLSSFACSLFFFIFFKSTVKCLYCWHSFFPRKVSSSSSSSSFSSSVNDHQPQSWTLPSFLVHAGLFLCFHSPPNSDMDYRIFNVCV